MYVSRFVGRERELQQLLTPNPPARGVTPVLLLGATAGMGKSRLIAEYRRAVEPQRVIAVGACLQYAGAALWPFTQIVQSLGERSPQIVRAHPRIFERLSTFGDPDSAAIEIPRPEEKLRLFELFAGALRAFARDARIVLVLEDIQWSDSSSLELLQYLIGSAGTSDMNLIATYRNDEFGREHPLRPLLGRLLTMPMVRRMDLPPLADDEIDVLVQNMLAGTSIGKDERNAIRARAEGNPLFAEELARHVREHHGSDRCASLPLSVEGAVCARLPALATDERTILLHAAVIGREFDAGMVAAVADLPLPRVLEALRRSRELAFIVESPAPRFSFSHALTREALYNELLEVERRAIHARTLEILEAQHGAATPVAPLAYHAWAARDAGKTARYNEQAGDWAAQAGAIIEAATFYERALAMGSRDDGPRLHEKLGCARLSAGFPELAIKSFREALDLRSAEQDRAGIAACALGIAESYAYLGEEERGLEYLERARDVLAADPRHHFRVRAIILSARIALADHDIVAALHHLSAVEEFSECLDNRSATLFYATRADTRLMQRRYDEAIADQERAVELSRGADDRRYEAEQHGLLGSVLLLAGRLERAAAAYRDAWKTADDNFDVGQAALYRAHYAEVRLMLGNTLDAKSIVIELLGLAVQTENPAFIVLLGRIGLFLSLRTGDRALAKRIVERLELDERFRFETPRQLFPVSGAYAQLLLDLGRADEARAILRRAVDRLTQKRLRSTDWSVCTLITVAAHGQIDDLPIARAVLASSFSALASAFLSFFDAIAALRAHREEESRAFARAAAIGLRSFAFRYEEALAWELAGEKQVALDLFEQQGAHNDVRRVQRSMIAINRRGRAENELTAREQEVARAIAGGETNRMIAERYCISEKTVESHVASIFNRLGVRSRGEVAARLATPMSDANV